LLLRVPRINIAVLVNATPILPGDFDRNGVVDAADYGAWRKSVGTTYMPSDYDLWRAHFGQTVGVGATANYMVPEPPLWIIFSDGRGCSLRISPTWFQLDELQAILNAVL
jgi:hypothetical protein